MSLLLISVSLSSAYDCCIRVLSITKHLEFAEPRIYGHVGPALSSSGPFILLAWPNLGCPKKIYPLLNHLLAGQQIQKLGSWNRQSNAGI